MPDDENTTLTLGAAPRCIPCAMAGSSRGSIWGSTLSWHATVQRSDTFPEPMSIKDWQGRLSYAHRLNTDNQGPSFRGNATAPFGSELRLRNTQSDPTTGYRDTCVMDASIPIPQSPNPHDDHHCNFACYFCGGMQEIATERARDDLRDSVEPMR
ncbi:hypothetical protein M8818_001927 [Zalaria obscura]|uniref:Uncharacterized protein n=1 Tax=Zalaria obscura TaxID=2024903 RepID=A0ACC3SII1_9PEZI